MKHVLEVSNIRTLIILTICKTLCSNDSLDCALLHFYHGRNFPQEETLPLNMGTTQICKWLLSSVAA